MTNYYDGARAEAARLVGGLSPQPEIEGPLLSDLLKALEMSEKIGLDRHRTQELRDAIKIRLFGVRVVRGASMGEDEEDIEDAEVLEEEW